MKKLSAILMLLMLGAFFSLSGCVPESPDTASLTDDNQPPVQEQKEEFTMSDLILDTLKYGDSQEAVTAALGEPAVKNTWQEGATGYDITEYTYANGNKLTFVRIDEGKPFLRAVTVVARENRTARGLGAGSTQAEVLNAFRNDGMEGGILYAAETEKITESETIIIPPRGFISSEPDEQGRTSIHYDVPVTPYQNEQEKDAFVYQSHGSLWFLVKNGIVEEYGWFVGAMAE